MGDVEDLKEFPIISLVGGLYELLTKVLISRFKRTVRMVSNFYHTFVEGRQILDVVLIENEAIDSRLKGLESGVICKKDIEKAYNHVNWGLLLAIMEKMGFGAKWLRWMKCFIS